MRNEPVAAGVRTMLWRKGRDIVEDFPLEEVSEHLEEAGTLVWVDLCVPSEAALGELANELSLDRHAVADSISHAERPKATRHESHTFVTVYATRLKRDGAERGLLESRVETSQVSAFVLRGGVVTVRPDDRFDVEQVVQRWSERADLLEYGSGALLHGLLDVIVDGHFESIQLMDEAIDALEDGLFDEGTAARKLQERTYRLRKELADLRRVVLPMRDVVATVMRHRADSNARAIELDGWYADLYDHVLRASEQADSLREMVTTVFETNIALQDARLNSVMKKLTGWAAIIAVPTAVTGWFGMNVAYPGVNRASGFFASTVVIAGLALGLYLVFKRRGWI